MSLIPLLASLAREIDNSHVGLHDIDDGFGFGMYPCDIYQPRRTPFQLNPIRRYVPYERSIHKIHGIRDSKEKLTVGKNGFQVSVDVTQFKPNELTVKTVGNQVVVEGKHEEREDDHGYISRQFVRKYNLPTGFNPSDVISTISTDGVLTVKAPPPVKGPKNSERIVQIQQTGPAHLSVKDNQEEDPTKQPNGGPTKAEGNSKA